MSRQEKFWQFSALFARFAAAEQWTRACNASAQAVSPWRVSFLFFLMRQLISEGRTQSGNSKLLRLQASAPQNQRHQDCHHAHARTVEVENPRAPRATCAQGIQARSVRGVMFLHVPWRGSLQRGNPLRGNGRERVIGDARRHATPVTRAGPPDSVLSWCVPCVCRACGGCSLSTTSAECARQCRQPPEKRASQQPEARTRR